MKELIPEIVKVVKKRQETEDVTSLWVEANGFLPHEPGQFVMVSVFGLEEAPFSIAGSVKGTLMLTVRAVGGLTRALSALAPGDEVGLRGPFGRGFPVVEARGRPLVLIAGGIGLPPIRSVLETLATPVKDTYLLYGVKSPKDIIYSEILNEETWAEKGVKVLTTVDIPESGWKGHAGPVHGLLDLLDGEMLKGAFAFACGPEAMYGPLLEALKAKGVAGKNIYLSLERQMRCGTGKCWHCYWAGKLVCTDGPVFRALEAFGSSVECSRFEQ
jgi:NAD(P)H-flavin reductase